MTLLRHDGRDRDELRPITITRNFTKHAEGSVLLEMGGTMVLCTATVEDRLPPWMHGRESGWVTAEYDMLPRSTHRRTRRDASRGRRSGRSLEIQRLVGRSLRAVVDLAALGPRTIIVDCDVIQADGGTRTASVTGSFVALIDALEFLRKEGAFELLPVYEYAAAISVGVVDGRPVLDLDYEEDTGAAVDLNVVATEGGRLIEIQGTAEADPFTRGNLDSMLDLALRGIRDLAGAQRAALGPEALKVGRISRGGGDDGGRKEGGSRA